MSHAHATEPGTGSQGRDPVGWPVVDPAGARIGSVDGVWDDAGAGRPRYLSVRMGRLRSTETLLAPLFTTTRSALSSWSRSAVAR